MHLCLSVCLCPYLSLPLPLSVSLSVCLCLSAFVSVYVPLSLAVSVSLRLYICVLCNRNRHLKISKALLKSHAHQGTSLFTSAAMNQRGIFQRGQEKLRSDFQNTRRGQSSC